MRLIVLVCLVALIGCSTTDAGQENESTLESQARDLGKTTDDMVNAQINAIDAENQPSASEPQPPPKAPSDAAPAK
jgi:hypothetical protein